MKRTTLRSLIAMGATAALLAACGSGDGNGDEPTGGDTGGTTAETTAPEDSGEPVTLTWWHNSNTDPGLSFYEQTAADYMAEHPNVTIEITAQLHEEMLTQLEAAFQSGNNIPDIYMERGGGELRAHVEAGLTQDISESAAETIANLGGSVAGWQVDGKTYGLPFTLGVVGFWYNTQIWADAGVEPPATWDEFYDAMDTLKAAGVYPLSVGAYDGWPAAHYYYYFALRECSQEVLQDALANFNFDDPCLLKAGEDLVAFVDSEPFNPDFLNNPAGTAPGSAATLLVQGTVSAQMQGHWEPGVLQGVNDGEPMANLGWFPFPGIAGGAGDPAAAIGGGDGWAVSAGAPPEAVDFIEYLLSDEVQIGFAELDMGVPTNPAASGSVADPVLASLLDFRDSSPYVQLYFDTALGTNVGNAMNAAIIQVFSGQAGPDKIIADTKAAAALE